MIASTAASCIVTLAVAVPTCLVIRCSNSLPQSIIHRVMTTWFHVHHSFHQSRNTWNHLPECSRNKLAELSLDSIA
ncbi:hypothetical protein V8E55_004510 [Tylopilus felleus]